MRGWITVRFIHAWLQPGAVSGERLDSRGLSDETVENGSSKISGLRFTALKCGVNENHFHSKGSSNFGLPLRIFR